MKFTNSELVVVYLFQSDAIPGPRKVIIAYQFSSESPDFFKKLSGRQHKLSHQIS